MDADRAAAAETSATEPAIRRPETHPGSGGADGDPVRAAQRGAVEHAPARDGLRLGDDLLASIGALATGGRLETPARRAAGRIAPAGRVGSRAGRGRQLLPPRAAREKTGPNPTDRRKAGSKHHVLTDAHGIPLVASLTAANRNDITELLPLVNALPPLRGRPGRPVRKPALIQGDRAYDSQPHRDELHRRGIRTQLAQRRTDHGSGLGRTRWVVERTLAWLHRFRRLAVRYERRACVHEAFLTLGCALVCWYFLKPVS